MPAVFYAFLSFLFGSPAEIPAAVACLELEAIGVEAEIDLRSLDQPHLQKAFRDLDLRFMIEMTEWRRQTVAISEAGSAICNLGDLPLPTGQSKR